MTQTLWTSSYLETKPSLNQLQQTAAKQFHCNNVFHDRFILKLLLLYRFCEFPKKRSGIALCAYLNTVKFASNLDSRPKLVVLTVHPFLEFWKQKLANSFLIFNFLRLKLNVKINLVYVFNYQAWIWILSSIIVEWVWM